MAKRTKFEAVVYRRVSTVSQGRDEGWSLQSQENKASTYCAANGLTIVRVFEEVASASKVGRRAFGEMVSYLRKHPGVALVVEKVDRLTRNRRDAATLDELVEEGLVIHFVRENKILSVGVSPSERLVADIHAAVATHYRRNLSRECRKGLAARFAAGKAIGGAPFGYVYPPRLAGQRSNIVQEPAAAAIVRALYEACAAGEGMSRKDLQLLARDLGYPAPRGQLIGKCVVLRILQNPAYAGWVCHKGVVRKGTHEPIVSQALFDSVQEKLAQKRRRPRSELRNAYSGVFVCASCSGLVSLRQRRGRRYWACDDSCGVRYCPESKLDDEVLDALGQIRFPDGIFDGILRSLKAKRIDRQAIAEQQAVVQKEMALRAKLLEWRDDDDITDAQYRQRTHDSESREAAARERLARLATPCGEGVAALLREHLDLAKKFLALYAKARPAEQRRILGLLWVTDCRASRSKVDLVTGSIVPSWRPCWAALVEAKVKNAVTTRKLVDVLSAAAVSQRHTETSAVA